MHDLKTIIETTQACLNGERPTVDATYQCDSFDAAWRDYMNLDKKNPDDIRERYAKASSNFMGATANHNKTQIQIIHDATRFVALSYIYCGYEMVDLRNEQRDKLTLRTAPKTPQDDEILRHQIASVLGVHTSLIIEATKVIKNHIETDWFKDGLQPREVTALGEFYTLSIFALQQLRDDALTVHNKDYDANIARLHSQVRRYGLQKLLARQLSPWERAAKDLVSKKPEYEAAGVEVLLPGTKPKDRLRRKLPITGPANVIIMTEEGRKRYLARVAKRLAEKQGQPTV